MLQVEPLENGANAMQATVATFVPDSTKPTVDSFDVSLDDGCAFFSVLFISVDPSST